MPKKEISKPEIGKVKILSEQEREERARVRKLLKENYKFTKELTESHISFLKDIEQHEENRLSGIESKLSSIIGQSGIIFTLIALFIPLFLNDLNQLPILLKIFYCTLFAGGLIFFTKSILAASATLKINDFPYARPDINSTFAETTKEKSVLFEGQVKDLITTIEVNTASNTKKGHNLMIAHRAFVYGLIIMGAFGLMLTVQSLFYKKENDPDLIMLKNMISIQNQVNESRRLIDEIKSGQKRSIDSLQIEIVRAKLDTMKISLDRMTNYYDKKR
jgi:hypothetical protein